MDTSDNKKHLDIRVLVIDSDPDEQLHHALSRAIRDEIPHVSLLFDHSMRYAEDDIRLIGFNAVVLGTSTNDLPTNIAAKCDELGRIFGETPLILFVANDVPLPTIGNWTVIPRHDVQPLLHEIKRVLRIS